MEILNEMEILNSQKRVTLFRYFHIQNSYEFLCKWITWLPTHSRHLQVTIDNPRKQPLIKSYIIILFLNKSLMWLQKVLSYSMINANGISLQMRK